MNTGIIVVLNQIAANPIPPSLPLRRRNQTWRNARVIWTFPRPQRSRCFHSPPISRGSSAHTTAVGSNTTRGPAAGP